MTQELDNVIRVKIEGFGAIERQLPPNLTLQCEPDSSVAAVLKDVVAQYPAVHGLLERCACAIGEDIIPRQTILSRDCTLVLLSPVAGG
ncbi:MoaD/ThiS family protein [Acinetobacter johnsonii]|uniref:MoaD/ThiS family protein n=1 Tax=Acinetobacter johnsonii TaxID=40214 RepID=UPI0011E7D305|nr:MoaD/ThiS family protein [Acinetobacter johnsonii]MDH1712293.1 MoaD/ThiS family protein [Acinetobacter johnsonii]QEK35347.1 MoaD/ThiS family protein [Acinetobacter johnsonii]